MLLLLLRGGDEAGVLADGDIRLLLVSSSSSLGCFSVLAGPDVVFKSDEADAAMADRAVAGGATNAALLQMLRHFLVGRGHGSFAHDNFLS
jgi:hypothetical protein